MTTKDKWGLEVRLGLDMELRVPKVLAIGQGRRQGPQVLAGQGSAEQKGQRGRGGTHLRSDHIKAHHGHNTCPQATDSTQENTWILEGSWGVFFLPSFRDLSFN